MWPDLRARLGGAAEIRFEKAKVESPVHPIVSISFSPLLSFHTLALAKLYTIGLS